MILDATTLEPFEIGAMLLAVLAFPGRNEGAAMRNATLAWCSRYLAKARVVDPVFASELEREFPAYAAVDSRWARRALMKTTTRYRRRMAAARIARGFLQEASTGRPAVLPPEMDKLVMRALYRLVRRDCRISDVENVRKLVWVPSKPIIHLATAVDVFPKLVGSAATLQRYELDDLDAHRTVVALAGEHERHIPRDRRFGVTSQELIRLHWVE